MDVNFDSIILFVKYLFSYLRVEISYEESLFIGISIWLGIQIGSIFVDRLNSDYEDQRKIQEIISLSNLKTALNDLDLSEEDKETAYAIIEARIKSCPSDEAIIELEKSYLKELEYYRSSDMD